MNSAQQAMLKRIREAAQALRDAEHEMVQACDAAAELEVPAELLLGAMRERVTL